MNKYLILLMASVLLSCNPTKKVAVKEVAEKVPEPLLVELKLNDKPDYFVWKKGAYLDLNGTITNNSEVPITILSPQRSYQVNNDYFGVVFKENFEGEECVFEVTEDDLNRTPDEFVVILPGESEEFYIGGRNYFIQYCNEDQKSSEAVTVNLVYNYYETKHDYTSDSYFITNKFKVELSEDDEQRLQNSLRYIKESSRFQKKSEEDQASYLENREKVMRDELITATPEEQAVMIEKYNSLFGRKLESNAITLKVEL